MIERIAFEPLRQVAAPWRMYGQVYDEVSNLSPDEGGSVAKKHQPWKTTWWWKARPDINIPSPTFPGSRFLTAENFVDWLKASNSKPRSRVLSRRWAQSTRSIPQFTQIYSLCPFTRKMRPTELQYMTSTAALISVCKFRLNRYTGLALYSQATPCVRIAPSPPTHLLSCLLFSSRALFFYCYRNCCHKLLSNSQRLL